MDHVLSPERCVQKAYAVRSGGLNSLPGVPRLDGVRLLSRRPGAEEKFSCPGSTFAVIPLIIELIQRYPLFDEVI